MSILVLDYLQHIKIQGHFTLILKQLASLLQHIGIIILTNAGLVISTFKLNDKIKFLPQCYEKSVTHSFLNPLFRFYMIQIFS